MFNCLEECNTLHCDASRLLQMSEMFLALCWIRKTKKKGRGEESLRV